MKTLSDQLLAQPANALCATKHAIHLDEGLVSKLSYLSDTEAYIACLQTKDAAEGIAAFKEKRPPRFTN